MKNFIVPALLFISLPTYAQLPIEIKGAEAVTQRECVHRNRTLSDQGDSTIERSETYKLSRMTYILASGIENGALVEQIASITDGNLLNIYTRISKKVSDRSYHRSITHQSLWSYRSEDKKWFPNTQTTDASKSSTWTEEIVNGNISIIDSNGVRSEMITTSLSENVSIEETTYLNPDAINKNLKHLSIVCVVTKIK